MASAKDSFKSTVNRYPLEAFYLYCTRNPKLRLVSPQDSADYINKFNQYKSIQYNSSVVSAVLFGLGAQGLRLGSGFSRFVIVAGAALVGAKVGSGLIAPSLDRSQNLESELSSILARNVELLDRKDALERLERVI